MVLPAESILQERKRLVRSAKRIKKTADARKATRKALAPKRKPVKRDWLTQPVKRYKLVGAKRRYKIPEIKPALIPLAPAKQLKGVRHVSGNVPGTALQWLPVISSNVAALAYDEGAEECHCAFLDGSHYVYYGFPAELWLRWSAAPSKGGFLWREVRDKFAYERLA
jgi:hypothetical protein